MQCAGSRFPLICTPRSAKNKKIVGFWVVSHVQIGIESAQIFLSSPLAEAPPQTSTSPALFGVRSMQKAKSDADNPPSTCDGLLQTRPKQHIWGPLPQVPFQGPPRVELPRELSCPGSRAAPRAELQRFHSPATLGGPKLISNGRGGASKLAPRYFAYLRRAYGGRKILGEAFSRRDP